jgi:hypothetical protein
MNNSINDLRTLLQNENYIKYYELKLEIQSRYPREIWDATYTLKKKQRKFDMTDEFKEQWDEYKKEICDLILQPNGYFQEFVWDLMGEVDKLIQERRARGRMIKPKIEY